MSFVRSGAVYELPIASRLSKVSLQNSLSCLLYMCGVAAILLFCEVEMKIISFTEARNSLKSVLDQVINNADCAVITRRDSEDAVVMSLQYYQSLMETVYLLRLPANAEHLRKSIAQYSEGKVLEKDLIDE